MVDTWSNKVNFRDQRWKFKNTVDVKNALVLEVTFGMLADWTSPKWSAPKLRNQGKQKSSLQTYMYAYERKKTTFATGI